MRILAHLAETKNQEFVPIKKIAEQESVPTEYAYKIIRKLNKAEITRSQVGVHGGVVLNKNLQDITLHSVIEIIQGPVCISECVLNPAVCPRNPGCKFFPRWSAIQKELIGLLASTTMADILEGE